jgi:chromosomal replication initiation ATPase DnaA
MYLIQRYRGVGNLEVGRLFGGVHYSAVSKASGKLKEEMASDKKLASFGDEIISQFET